MNANQLKERPARSWDGYHKYRGTRWASSRRSIFGDLVQGCTDWQELELLWDNCKHDIRQGYPEVALKFLMRQSKPPDPRFLDKILWVLKEHIPYAVPRQVVSCLHACAKMSYGNVLIVDQILQKVWQTRLHLKLKHSDVSHLCYTLGLLERNAPGVSIPTARVILEELRGQILVCLQERLLTEVEVMNLVYGLSKLQFGDGKILSALADVINTHVQMEEFTPHDLAAVFYSLGQLNIIESSGLSKWVVRMTDPKFLRFSDAIALSSVLFTFANIGDKTLHLIAPLLKEVVKPSRLAHYSDRTLPTICYSLKKLICTDPAILSPMCVELSREGRLQKFNNQAFCSVVCGLSRLQVRDAAFFGQAAHVVIGARGIQRFTTRELACLLCGFLSAGFKQRSFYQQVMDEIVTSDRLRAAESAELSSILYSASQLKEPDPDPIASILDEITYRIKRFTTEEISCIVKSCSTLGLNLNPHVDDIIQEAMDPQRLTSASEEYIAQLVQCMGTLNVRSKDNPGLEILLGEAGKESRMKRFGTKEISMILFGLGEMRCKTGLVVKLVYELSHCDLENFGIDSLTTIIYGLGRLSFPCTTSANFLIDEVYKTERLQQLGIRGLITVLLGMVQMQAHSSRIHVLLNMIRPRIANLSSSDVSKTLFAISYLPTMPQDLVDDLVQEILRPERMQEFDERSLSTTIYMLRKLKLDRQSILEILCQEAGKPSRLQKFSSEALSNMLWSVSKNGEQWFTDLLVDHLTSSPQLEAANVQTLVKTLEAISSIQVPKPNYNTI